MWECYREFPGDILGCNLIGRHFCIRSHYIARQTFATVEWKAQTFIHCKCLASSSVFRGGSSVDVFGWNSSKVFVNNGTVQWILREVPTNRTRASNTDTRISAGVRMYLQDSNVHDDVRSLVHCKFNDDQGKIGLISFMKTVTADRGSWTKRQGERC